jgi:hypothetical protein
MGVEEMGEWRPCPNSLKSKSLLVSSKFPFFPLLTFLPPFPVTAERRKNDENRQNKTPNK